MKHCISCLIYYVNICFHWSTKTLLPSAFWQLPKRMSCTLGNDRKSHSYTQFSGFSGLFYCVYCIFNASFTTSTDLNYLSITFCKSPSCDKSCNTFKNLKFRFLNIQFPYVHHDALLLSLFCNECYIHQNKVRLSCFFDSMFSLSSLYFFWSTNKKIIHLFQWRSSLCYECILFVLCLTFCV